MVVKTDADLYVVLGLDATKIEAGLNAILGTAARATEKAAAAISPALEKIPVDKLNSALTSVGETIDAFARRLGITGQDISLLQWSFGSAGIGADEFRAMLEVAAVQAEKTGQTVVQALDDIINRFSKLNEQGARNLGASMGLPPVVIASFRNGKRGLDAYSAALSRASARQAQLSATGTRMGGVLTRVAGFLSSFAAPLAGVLSLGSVTTAFFDAAKEIDDTSRSLRVSTDALQLWRGAAREAGVGASEFDKVLQSASQTAIKYGTTTEKEFERMRQMYGRMSLRQANAVGAREGLSPESVNFLRMNNKEFQRQIDLQKKLGVIDKRAIESARKLRFAKEELRETYNRLSAQIMGKFSPAFEWVIKKFTQFVNFLRENETFTTAVIIGIAAAVTAFLLPALTALAAAVLMNPITWIFIAVAAAIGTVAALIDDLFTFMEGGDSLFDWTPIVNSIKAVQKALKPLIEFFKKSWPGAVDTAKKILKVFVDTFVNNFQDLINLVGTIIENFAKVVEKVFNLISAIFSGDKEKIVAAAKDLFLTIINAAKENLAAIWGFLEKTLVNLWQNVRKHFPDFAKWAEDSASSIIKFLVGAFNSVLDAAKSLLDWLPDSVRSAIGLSVTATDESVSAPKASFTPTSAMTYANLEPVSNAVAGSYFPDTGFGAYQGLRPVEIDRSRSTEINVDQKITNNITASDPKATADAVSSRLSRSNDDISRKLTNSSNTGVM